MAGAVVWVGGTRAVGLPQPVALGAGAIVAVAGAIFRKQQEPENFGLDDPALERELQTVREQAAVLATRAGELQAAATAQLGAAGQVRLLAAVQFACDRARELPDKLAILGQQLQGQDSLLSMQELQLQLEAAKGKLKRIEGTVARDRLEELVASLENNIRLAARGRDTRQAQAISLAKLVADSTAVLQELQNQLRSANLDNEATVKSLQGLADKLGDMQE
ncbi:MAG: hypothetical protein AAFY11_12910, partial [Cyanobacteria bacterium J06641_5]